jgi:glycosyltransferase involved in cell wall biosynthesis
MKPDKPRPFIIVTGDFVQTGGMDRANHALAQYLADTPDVASAVHLVAHRVSDDLLACPRLHFHQVPKILDSYWLSGHRLSRAGHRVAKQVAKSADPLLIVNGGNCQSRLACVNWVHYVHAAFDPSQHGDLPVGSPHRRLKQTLARRDFLRQERMAFGRAPLLIANSHLTANQMAEFYQVDRSRMEVVYYGTDQMQFRPVTQDHRQLGRRLLGLDPQDQSPVVVFVGALGDSRKGFDILMQAWGRLSQNLGWNARLFVVGAGASLRSYQDLCQQLGLSRGIRFLGFRQDVPEILAGCDLLVSPARYEAYGLNVHEALCRGLPVLVSDQAGVAERIRHISPLAADKFCVPAANADSLVRGLINWHSSQQDSREIALQVGHELGRESWSDQMEKFVNLAISRQVQTVAPAM